MNIKKLVHFCAYFLIIAVMSLPMAKYSAASQQDPAVDLTVGVDNASDPAYAGENLERVVLAAGCFWCLESALEHVDGVVSAVSGYAGGQTKNPTYPQVGTGQTGHRESVLVIIDTKKISYSQLLKHFWHNVDPFDDKGQFVDRGSPYLSAIFPLNAEQREQAQKSLNDVEKMLNGKVVTPISDIDIFYPAENYHQDYWRTSPIRYRLYTLGNGREARLKKIWGVDRQNYEL